MSFEHWRARVDNAFAQAHWAKDLPGTGRSAFVAAYAERNEFLFDHSAGRTNQPESFWLVEMD
jgi:hypothetical protein